MELCTPVGVGLGVKKRREVEKKVRGFKKGLRGKKNTILGD